MTPSPSSRPIVEKIVSGGQTGVDRAALDAALAMNMARGGWCPKGRLAEDGVIDAKYPLTETPSSDYAQRTEWNVRDSDGTLVLTIDEPTGGTALTIRMADQHGKPVHIVRLAEGSQAERVRGVLDWLKGHGIRTVNIAGPRKSTSQGVQGIALRFLHQLLE